ncbi:MAG: 2-vinyl bacteriochlorophyllide hydratase [Devosiaceae bacterium]|nr:2-vinyl bacteriochlorophyllide hydratase [Devosiaceae bacterium MH13]
MPETTRPRATPSQSSGQTDAGLNDRQPTGNQTPFRLYSAEERARRDATVWTLVQGVLAPVQFLVFLISLALVIRYLVTGEGFFIATASVVIKTLVLYAIMITGAIWEKVVFGRYLFAPAFLWEDVFSMLVLALHTAYLVAVFTNALGPSGQMLLALAAYATYVINAAQFVWKLRVARLEGAALDATPAATTPAAIAGGAS